jgi:hypothetical protein
MIIIINYIIILMVDTNILKEHAVFLYQLPPKRGYLPIELYNVTIQKTTISIIKTFKTYK